MGVSWYPQYFLIVTSTSLNAAWISNIWRSQSKASRPNTVTHCSPLLVPPPPPPPPHPRLSRTCPMDNWLSWIGKFPQHSEMQSQKTFQSNRCCFPFGDPCYHERRWRSGWKHAPRPVSGFCHALRFRVETAAIAWRSPGFPISQGWGGRPRCVCFVMFLAAAVFACSIHQSLESSLQY